MHVGGGDGWLCLLLVVDCDFCGGACDDCVGGDHCARVGVIIV